jgi:hypothetical protein
MVGSGGLRDRSFYTEISPFVNTPLKLFFGSDLQFASGSGNLLSMFTKPATAKRIEAIEAKVVARA